MDIGCSTKIVLRFLFFLYFYYFPKTSLYIATTWTRDIAWCPGSTKPRHHNVTSVDLGVSNGCPQCTTFSGGPHDIRRRWVAFFLTSLNPVKGWLHWTGEKGGPALTVSWYIFGNTEMHKRRKRLGSNYTTWWRVRTYQERHTSQRGSWGINSMLPENNLV